MLGTLNESYRFFIPTPYYRILGRGGAILGQVLLRILYPNRHPAMSAEPPTRHDFQAIGQACAPLVRVAWIVGVPDPT